MTGKVDYTIQDGIAEAIIDNPPVNATSAGVRAGLADAVKRFEADADAKALVIRCAGKTFVAGADIKEFGKPMALLLLHAHATVTICHSKTRDLAATCREADILVAAVGRPRLVGADHVREGAVVIDVGMNRNDEGKLCGDVDFDAVREALGATGWITPVPGGVGPMTITMLLANTVDAAEATEAANA